MTVHRGVIVFVTLVFVALGLPPAAAATPAATQTTVVSGVVVATTGRTPIPGATISAEGARATTDAQGRFSIAVTPASPRLSVSAVGFLDQNVVVATGQTTPLEIALVRAPTLREEMTVSAESDAEPAPAAIAVAP